MTHEDALFELTEAARALLSTLAAEGIDIPETRALAFALASAKTRTSRHSDTSKE